MGDFPSLADEQRRQQALQRLDAALAHYTHDRETSVPDEPSDPDPVEPGDPVHDAVVAVEEHYGGKLPIEGGAWGAWQDLLRYSRGKGNEGHSEQAKRAYEAAERLLNWAREQIKNNTASILERVLAVLTPNQSRIFEYLWTHQTASYDRLATVPGAFQAGPVDEAITQALKRIVQRLNQHVELNVTLRIETAKRRVNIQTVAGQI